MTKDYISISEIIELQSKISLTNKTIAELGRKIYEIRNLETFPPSYGFEKYYIQNYGGFDHYCGQEGPIWKTGEQILIIAYWWPRAEDYIHITFPTKWLRDDWMKFETNRSAMDYAKERFSYPDDLFYLSDF